MGSRSLFDLCSQSGDKASRLLARCRAVGIDLAVTDTYRSFAEQDALYHKGRTAPGRIVTHARGGQSFHNVRRALDVAFRNGDKAVTWDGDWDMIGHIGVECGFFWGGNFERFKDRPHFEDRYCGRCGGDHVKAMSFEEDGSCSLRDASPLGDA